MPRALIVAACLILAPACSDPTSPGAEGVGAEIRGEAMTVVNLRSHAIYYFAVDGSDAPLILWGPCTDPDQCPRVEPRGSRAIPLDEIGFWEPTSTVALLYWWHLVPAGDGTLAPDSIRTLVVKR